MTVSFPAGADRAAAESLRNTRITGQQDGTAQASIYSATPATSARLLRDVRDLAGVASAALVYTGDVQDGQDPASVWIGNCLQIVAAARLASVPCGDTPVIVAADRTHLVPARGGAIEIGNLNPALERVRTLVRQRVPGGQVATRVSTYDGYSRDVRRLYRVLTIAALGVFVVTGLGLVVAVAVGLLERRRPFALLRASGTPVRRCGAPPSSRQARHWRCSRCSPPYWGAWSVAGPSPRAGSPSNCPGSACSSRPPPAWPSRC